MLPSEDLWPTFRPEWIVYEDDDLIAVHKRAGLSVAQGDPDRHDDLVTRLRAFLGKRDAKPREQVYLGVHEHLDRDCSGVVVFTKRRSANRSMAGQWEGRTVASVWELLVAGPDLPKRCTVRGETVVLAALDSLLDHKVDAGRRVKVTTHRARARDLVETIGAAGSTVLGDRRPASRLMCDRRALGFLHPTSSRRLIVDRGSPREFELAGSLVPQWTEVLRLAAEQRYGICARTGGTEDTTAFRWVHGLADFLPGIEVDQYGDHAVVQVEERCSDYEPLLDALMDLGVAGVYLKRRPAHPSRIAETIDEWAPPSPVRGIASPFEFEIREHGLAYPVRLGDGLSTGIFLDQRENRRRVRDAATDRRVLNLFSHAGAFTIAAASGGAARTLSVDASGTLTERAKASVEALGTSGEHRFVQADAFKAVHQCRRRREVFDLVIADPPTFSTTRRSRWRSGRDWLRLLADLLAILEPGGTLLATSHDRALGEAQFSRYLKEAAREVGRTIGFQCFVEVPPDFRPPAGLSSHLKSLWARVDV